MRQQKKVKVLARLIEPYGLRIETSAHRRIVNEKGQAVYWFPGSPSCPYFADNIVRDLVKMGLVPKQLKTMKIR